MHSAVVIFSCFIFSYLSGSIPCSLLISRWFGGIDIREIGSGNPGTTNVYRAMGLKWALLAFGCDALKGFFPVLLTWRLVRGVSYADWWIAIAGLLAVFGHMFSVFLNFKGGKGVATAFGVFAFLSPLASLAGLVIWGVLTFKYRIVSISSMAAALALPFLVAFFSDLSSYRFAALLTAILILVAHRENISRLTRGEEKAIQKNVDRDS